MFKKRSKKAKAFLSALLAGMLLFSSVVYAADTITYSKLLKMVEPKAQSTVVPGEIVTIRALADKNAAVYATVDSEQVTLSRTAVTRGSYYWFEGSYTVPDLQEGTNLGTIVFTAVKNGISEKMTAPGLVVVEAALKGNKSVTAVSGQKVTVTADYADVFIDNDRGEDYAAPYYFELPKGTIDYIESVGSNTYILKSGRKVLQSDVKLSSSTGSMGNNIISSITAKKSNEFTTLTIKGKWNVPFNIETAPFTYSGKDNTVSSYNASKVIITFDYTTAFDFSSISLPRNGAFSSASWTTTTSGGIAKAILTLTLSEKGKYYGCYAEYTSDGTLELRFHNPISDLSDAKIVIDPGHGYFGGTNPDYGAIQGSYYESDMNLAKASALKKELERRGADVYMLDSQNTYLKDLYERVDLATEWEPHIYISVHHNSTAASTTAARGVEVYYNTPFSMPLADVLADQIYSAYQTMDYASGASNRGDRFSEFCVTRTKQFASVLIEYGFMNNPEELKVLTNEKNIDTFAKYTADAIEEYFK